MVVKLLVMGCNAVNGSTYTVALKKIRICQRNYRIQWGRSDCKSKETIPRIVSDVEVLKLNYEAIVWQILFPDYLAGVCYYAGLVPRGFP